jgi:hypothetical protein
MGGFKGGSKGGSKGAPCIEAQFVNPRRDGPFWVSVTSSLVELLVVVGVIVKAGNHADKPAMQCSAVGARVCARVCECS